jgi:hypothetical protein
VFAQASTTRPEIYKEVEETMMFMLDFPSGARAACQTSFGINMNLFAGQLRKRVGETGTAVRLQRE